MRLYLSLFCIIFFSCQSSYEKKAWDIANNCNNPEVTKFLSHYKSSSDTEKYKAACFLVENMLNKYYIEPETSKLIKDIDIIIADSLIQSLEYSFKLKDSEFAANYSFEQFCEYLLPYRVANEPLSYHWKWDCPQYTYLTGQSISETAKAINSQIHIDIAPEYYGGHIKRFSTISADKYGKCDDRTIFTAMVLRSMGIPATYDFVPIWGSCNNGHSFTSVVLPDDTCMPLSDQNTAADTISFWRKTPKIYRYTYQINKKHSAENNLPQIIAHTDIIDVTSLHNIPQQDIVLNSLTESVQDSYLCVPLRGEWEPVAYGVNGKFHDVGTSVSDNKESIDSGKGIIYLPAKYVDGKVVPISPPIIHSTDGIRIINKLDECERVILYRKYPLNNRMLDFSKRMIRGVFEGANNPDFSDAEIIHTITIPPLPRLQQINIEEPKQYHYVRYRRSKGIFSIAELNVKDKNGKAIDFRPIGCRAIEKSGKIFNVFDRNPLTYFEVNGGIDLWIGCDLRKAQSIGYIEFAPRNDDNCVSPGDEYELFFWDNEWISLGQKTAVDYSLVYENVPKGALLWLKNLTKGKEERPFTYEDGKQIWW